MLTILVLVVIVISNPKQTLTDNDQTGDLASIRRAATKSLSHPIKNLHSTFCFPSWACPLPAMSLPPLSSPQLPPVTPRMRQRTVSRSSLSHSTHNEDDPLDEEVSPLAKDLSSTVILPESIREEDVGSEVSLLGGSGNNNNNTALTPPSFPSGRLLLLTGLSHLRKQWKILLAGQVLSFLLATTGAAQATLQFDCHMSAPTLTLGTCYAVLSLTLFYVRYEDNVRRKQQSGSSHKEPPDHDHNGLHDLNGTSNHNRSNGNHHHNGNPPPHAPYYFLNLFPLQAPPLIFLPMAILDVYANYFTILAFKYTTITSVTLFDALAIPSAMVLSRIFLNRHYSAIHLLAVGSCIIGILLNVWQDYEDDIRSESRQTKSGLALDDIYPHRTLGDSLAIVGGLLFGASNTAGEYAVRQLGGPYTYIGMMSMYGTAICLVQMFLIERGDIAQFTRQDLHQGSPSGDDDTCSLGTAQWLLVSFTLSTAAVYLGTARFLEVSDAAFFNLSLLTGDLWSVLFSIYEEGIVPGALFFVALVFIVSGVIVYEMTDEPSHGVREGKPHGGHGIELTAATSTISDDDNETKSLLVTVGQGV